MYTRYLSILFMIIFGMSTLCYASDDEKSIDERDDRLFPKMTESKLFTGIPIFDPLKDMQYLSVQSRYKIQGIAESFSALREYIQKLIVKGDWEVHSASPQLSPSGTANRLQKGANLVEYKRWIDQLTDMQNACCYFLSSKEYGSFIELLQTLLAHVDNLYTTQMCTISLKVKDKLASQTPTYITIAKGKQILWKRFFVISEANLKKQFALERITRLNWGEDPTDLLTRLSDTYDKKRPLNHESPPFDISDKFKNYLDELSARHKQFDFLIRSLKVSMSFQDRAILGIESPVALIAKNIGLIPDCYKQFQELRHEKIFHYTVAPAASAVSVNGDTVQRLQDELEVAKALMTLEHDFMEVFSDISTDKANAWMREAEVIS